MPIPPILPENGYPTWEESVDLKCAAVAMVDRALAGDFEGMADLMPATYIDAVNMVGTLALIAAGGISSKVGPDPTEWRKWLDTLRAVIKEGQGL